MKNISKESQDFMQGSQYLYDNKGNKIELESNTVNSNENPNNVLLMPKVNPGNNATYTLFNDINKDASANKLEVHDSMFSSGATIQLS